MTKEIREAAKGHSVFFSKVAKRWVVKYRAPAGAPVKWPRKSMPFEILEHEEARAHRWAETYLCSPEAAHARKTQKPGPKVGGKLIRDLEEPWLALQTGRYERGKIKKATYKNYVTHLKCHIVPMLGHHRPSECSIPTLRAFVRALQERKVMSKRATALQRHEQSSEVARTIGPSQCWNVVKTLTAFLEGCRDDALVPWFEVTIRSKAVLDELPARKKPNPIAMTLIAAQHLIGSPRIPLMWRVKYVVAFTTSLADGELCGLRVGDIYLDGVDEGDADLPVLEVMQALQLEGLKGRNDPGEPKTSNRQRWLPLHPAAVAALRLWLRSGYFEWCGSMPEPHMPLFPQQPGAARVKRNGVDPWTLPPQYMRTNSAKVLRRHLAICAQPTEVNGEPVTMHATRRSVATWLEELGAPDTHRKRIMGHAVPDVTDRHYTAKTKTLLRQLQTTINLLPLRWGAAVEVVPALVPDVVRQSTPWSKGV